MYDIWYDRKMGYGVIGPVAEGFPIKPGYSLMQMFTRAIEPGGRAMKIDGRVEDVWAAAVKGERDGLAVFVLNRVHAEKQVTISGLRAGQRMKRMRWNADGKGLLSDGGTIQVDSNGIATISLMEQEVDALMN
jgi:hypothetical protein